MNPPFGLDRTAAGPPVPPTTEPIVTPLYAGRQAVPSHFPEHVGPQAIMGQSSRGKNVSPYDRLKAGVNFEVLPKLGNRVLLGLSGADYLAVFNPDVGNNSAGFLPKTRSLLHALTVGDDRVPKRGECS